MFCAENSSAQFFLGRNRPIKELQINNQIQDREVRLIGADGEQLGIMPIAKAQSLADEAELDLVKIAPTAQPPVCKIMDYGKHRYEQIKRERVVCDEWTPANGLLSQTLKLKRAKLNSRYSGIISEIYR